jgi:hypothetical protein
MEVRCRDCNSGLRASSSAPLSPISPDSFSHKVVRHAKKDRTMPAPSHQTPAPLPEYDWPPEPSEKVDWARLKAIDLSKVSRPGGLEELAVDITEALKQPTGPGFFYVDNYDIPAEQVNPSLFFKGSVQV